MVNVIPGSVLPPPPTERLTKLQESFGRRFPQSYLDFLLTANGASIVESSVSGTTGNFVVERFLPIVADPGASEHGWADVAVVAAQIDSRIVESEDETGLPLVPIAALFAGDFLMLDYRHDPIQPAISRWSHEASNDFAPVTQPVAPSFDAFLQLLDCQAAAPT